MKNVKKSSVSTIILISIISGIVLYSLILFTIVRSRLDSGLVDFFESDIKAQARVVYEEINTYHNEIKEANEFVADIAADTFDGEFNEFAVNQAVASVTKHFGVETCVVTDKYANQVSTTEFGDVPSAGPIKSIITSGGQVQTCIKPDNNVYAIRVDPIKINGKLVGSVFSKMRITSEEFVSRTKNSTGCEFTVFNGYMREYTSMSGAQHTEIADKSIIDGVKNGRDFIGKTKINGTNYLAYYFPIYDDTLSFVTTLYLGKNINFVEELTSQIFGHLITAAILCTLLLIAALVFVIYTKVIKPLNGVGKAMENLASGDANLTVRLPVKGSDEFAKISSDVNTFIGSLQDIIKDLKNSEESLTNIGLSLGTSAQQSASATAEIMANIAGVRKQSENQSNAVDNTTNVLSESAAAVEVLSSLVEKQTAGVTESSAAIEEMLGNISTVTNSVRKMSDSFNILGHTVTDGQTKLTNVDAKVKEIAEQSKMLMQANQIISQIASETNLLAMNAAIEAAHAGKAGEGFSVVANEIRILAETSSKQSKNINAELKQISTSIKDVVTLSKDSQIAFTGIVDHLGSTDTIIREINSAMTEQEIASRQVFDSLASIRDQAGDVRIKTEEMSKGVMSVTRDMSNVSEISSTILGSMDEMTAGAKEISSSAQSVSDLASETKENIDTMHSKLSRFKV